MDRVHIVVAIAISVRVRVSIRQCIVGCTRWWVSSESKHQAARHIKGVRERQYILIYIVPVLG